MSDRSRETAETILETHRLHRAGTPLWRAPAAAIMLHGRGAEAAHILALADVLALPDIAYLAPEAERRTWYPHAFTAPRETNEPDLSNAMARIDRLVTDLVGFGLPRARIALLGFSQGAALALDYAAGRPARFGAVIGLSGALIGPDGTTRDIAGSLDGTPVFLGCSESDPEIPAARVEETAAHMRALGADVTLRLYPGGRHTINDDEIAHTRRLLVAMASSD